MPSEASHGMRRVAWDLASVRERYPTCVSADHLSGTLPPGGEVITAFPFSHFYPLSRVDIGGVGGDRQSGVRGWATTRRASVWARAASGWPPDGWKRMAIAFWRVTGAALMARLT